jgi:hypothetical protein
MNQNELEVAAEERLFDAMLDEVVHQDVPESRGVGSVRGGRSHWFAAAMVLFGMIVVAGVFVVSQAQRVVAVVPQEPEQDPLPQAVKVLGLAELQALDVATTNVTLQFQKPEDLAALGRFTRLRALQLEPDPEMSHEGFQSAWSLAPLAECKSLETISIGYFGTLDPTEFSVLTSLPKLQSLTLVGRDKVVDAALGSLLGKLPVRSLVLHAVAIEPEGMRALGELPLLERLELRDCDGLEKCDLQHLYRLRQLRHLGLRGLGELRPVPGPQDGTAVSFQLPETHDGKPDARIRADWMRGLAKALPELRELDLADSWVEDAALSELPKRLVSLGVEGSLGYGEVGIAAAMALPELRILRCGDPKASLMQRSDAVPSGEWLRHLSQAKLERFEFRGHTDADLVTAIRTQTDLRELRLEQVFRGTFAIRGGGGGVAALVEDPLPDVMPLGSIEKLARVELVDCGLALEQALRTALPARVHFEILPR